MNNYSKIIRIIYYSKELLFVSMRKMCSGLQCSVKKRIALIRHQQQHLAFPTFSSSLEQQHKNSPYSASCTNWWEKWRNRKKEKSIREEDKCGLG
jgi:hypothetical protein